MTDGGESVEAGTVGVMGAAASVCPRCGNYAVLVEQLGRAQCEDCWQRMREAGVGVGAVLGDVKRVALRLLVPAWVALAVVDLPLTVGGAFYTLRTGEDLPLRTSTLYYAVSLVAVGAVMHASHQVLMGEREVQWRQAWRVAGRRWGGMIAATWGANLVSLLFTLLLIIPGVMRALSYFLTTPVTLHEQTDMSTTLERSAERTRGHRWTVLGVLLSVAVLGFLPLVLVLTGVGVAVGLFADEGVGAGANALFNVVSELATHVPVALLTFATASLYVRCTLAKAQA